MDNSNSTSSYLHVVLNVFIVMPSHVDPTLLFQTLSLNRKIINPSFGFETWCMQFSKHLSTTNHDYR